MINPLEPFRRLGDLLRDTFLLLFPLLAEGMDA